MDSAGNIVEGLTNIVAIAVGESQKLALQHDGTVIGWATDSNYGQHQPPEGLDSVTAIAAARYHSMALKSNGTVVIWGSYRYTNCPAGLSNVVAIAGGTVQAVALRRIPKPVLFGNPTLTSNGQLEVPFTTEPETHYRIETSTNLIHWTPWANFTSTQTTNLLLHPTAPQSPPRFYRAVSP